jgi:hypothetical protein
MHHPVNQAKQFPQLLAIIPRVVETVYQLPLGPKATLGIARRPQRRDLGPRHLHRQRVILPPLPLQFVHQLADRKSQTALKVGQRKAVLTRTPLPGQVSQHRHGNDPLIERPEQAAMVAGNPGMRGASPASCRFMPKSTRFITICAWPCGCIAPPITPKLIHGFAVLGDEGRDDGVERPLARRVVFAWPGVSRTARRGPAG